MTLRIARLLSLIPASVRYVYFGLGLLALQGVSAASQQCIAPPVGPNAPGAGLGPASLPTHAFGEVVYEFDVGSDVGEDNLPLYPGADYVQPGNAHIPGNQPTIADFQHGWLYVGSGGFTTHGAPYVTWIDVYDPEAPTIEVSTGLKGGNKPHVSTFWTFEDPTNAGEYINAFISWKNGGHELSVLDFFTGEELGETLETDVQPMATGPQPPFEFRFESGYNGENLMTVSSFTPQQLMAVESGPQEVVTIDASTPGFDLPFWVGTTHLVGNLMIVAGSQGSGVAVFDASDVAAPLLLDSLELGGDAYSSMVYGSNLYVAERANGDPDSVSGVRRYDFSDPKDIQTAMGSIYEAGDWFLPLEDLTPRYLTLKDGKGYITPGTDQLIEFDASDMSLSRSVVLNGRSDFTFPFGNLIFVGGSDDGDGFPNNYTALLALDSDPDVLGPEVLFASPFNGEGDVALTSRIGFSLSDHISVTSLNSTSFEVRPVCGTAISGTYSTSHYGMINFAPDEDLLPNTMYEVILHDEGIEDVVGNPIVGDHIFRFTTEPDGSGPPTALKYWELDGDASPGGVAVGVDWVDGVSKQAAEFGIGDNTDHINVGIIDLPAQFTLTLWASIDDLQSNIHTLVANSPGSSSSSDGMRLMINSPSTKDGRVIFQTGDGTTSHSVRTASEVIQDKDWNFIAVTIDRGSEQTGTTGSARIFVNGCDMTDGSDLIHADFEEVARVHLSQMVGGGYDLEGRLDDVRIHSGLLSEADMDVLMAETFTQELLTINSFSGESNIVTEGSSTVLTVNAFDPNDPQGLLPLTYTFEFEGDPSSTVSGQAEQTTYQFDDPGRFTVTATVENTAGDQATKTWTQVVQSNLPKTPLPTHSTSIVYDDSRGLVYVVNPDNDSISALIAGTGSPAQLLLLDEFPVGDEPRFLALKPDASELWVSCAGDSTLWLYGFASNLWFPLALPNNSRPAGIAFSPDGSALYVAFEGTGGVTKYDTSTYSPVASTAPDLQAGGVRTPGLRGIAVSGDSTRVYATRFISESVDPGLDKGNVYEFNAALSTQTTIDLPHEATEDGESQGRGTPNYLMDVSLSPDSRYVWIPAKKDNTERGEILGGGNEHLNHVNTVRSILSRIELLTETGVVIANPTEDVINDRIDVDNQGLCSAVVFSPEGSVAFGAFLLNNEIMAFDAATGELIGGAEVGAAPDGLAIDADGKRLWVHNFLDRTVEVLDIEPFVLGTTSKIETGIAPVVVTVEHEALAADVLEGKRIFYNADDLRMTAEGYMSCASCHLAGGHDGRTWDFTNFDEGLRNTINLRGVRGMAQGNVHWTGNFDEIQDFTKPVFEHFGGTGFIDCPGESLDVADPNAGQDVDFDLLAAYVASLAKVPSSPYRTSSGILSANQLAGRAVFEVQNCASCHSGPLFTNSVISTTAFVPPGFDTPTLRGLWDGGPYFHDGSFQDLDSLFSSSGGVHNVANATDRGNLIAYLLQLDGPTRLLPLDDQSTGFTDESIQGTANRAIGLDTVAGVIGSSASFTAGDVVLLEDPELGERFTISLWADFTGTISSPGVQNYTLFTNSAAGATADGFTLRLKLQVQPYVELRTGNGSAVLNARTSSGSLPLSNWAHLAAVVDRVSGKARLYVNGVDQTTDEDILTDFANTGVARLGQVIGGGAQFTGMMDQVRVYDRLLTPGEIAELANE